MSTPKTEKSIVVIDPGSGTFKCGEAGLFVPRVVFDSVVGKPKLPGKLSTIAIPNLFILQVFILEWALAIFMLVMKH
jgi:actin-related protein